MIEGRHLKEEEEKGRSHFEKSDYSPPKVTTGETPNGFPKKSEEEEFKEALDDLCISRVVDPEELESGQFQEKWEEVGDSFKGSHQISQETSKNQILEENRRSMDYPALNSPKEHQKPREALPSEIVTLPQGKLRTFSPGRSPQPENIPLKKAAPNQYSGQGGPKRVDEPNINASFVGAQIDQSRMDEGMYTSMAPLPMNTQFQIALGQLPDPKKLQRESGGHLGNQIGKQLIFGTETPNDARVRGQMRIVDDLETMKTKKTRVESAKVSQIRVQWSMRPNAELITGIRFYYNNTQNGEHFEGKPLLGKELPSSQAFINLKENEYLIGVEGNASDHIHRIAFYTSAGRNWTFGKSAFRQMKIMAPEGGHLVFAKGGLHYALNFLAVIVQRVPESQAKLRMMPSPNQQQLLSELKYQVENQKAELAKSVGVPGQMGTHPQAQSSLIPTNPSWNNQMMGSQNQMMNNQIPGYAQQPQKIIPGSGLGYGAAPSVRSSNINGYSSFPMETGRISLQPISGSGVVPIQQPRLMGQNNQMQVSRAPQTGFIGSQLAAGSTGFQGGSVFPSGSQMGLRNASQFMGSQIQQGIPQTPIYMTKKLGNSNGNVFDHFHEIQTLNRNIQPAIFALRVWHDQNFLHGIEVDYLDQRTGGVVFRGNHKGTACPHSIIVYTTVSFEPEETINEFKGAWVDEYLKQVVIVTSKGRNIMIGQPVKGFEPVNVVPEGAKVIAVAGTIKTHLESLYFVYQLQP